MENRHDRGGVKMGLDGGAERGCRYVASSCWTLMILCLWNLRLSAQNTRRVLCSLLLPRGGGGGGLETPSSHQPSSGHDCSQATQYEYKRLKHSIAGPTH